jgi:hypothetical protein
VKTETRVPCRKRAYRRREKKGVLAGRWNAAGVTSEKVTEPLPSSSSHSNILVATSSGSAFNSSFASSIRLHVLAVPGRG